MAQKPQKDQTTKPTEADRTVRLPRKDLGLEKDEPTQALQMGVPAAESTLRLKRDEMAFEEPTIALKAGVPAADATLRLKREEMSLEEPTVALKAGLPMAASTLRLKRDEVSFEEPTSALQAVVPPADSTLRLKRDDIPLEEPTQALERPKLRTAMEVIDEATKVEPPHIKPSVMMPDATDIPSWEETTQFFTPPSSGHSETTVQVSRSLEPRPTPVDPSDSMDETFSNVSTPLLPQVKSLTPPGAINLALVTEISETEEDTLVLPDMHELDELPNAMNSTVAMPVMDAPAVPQEPAAMEKTTILLVEPAPPATEAPVAAEKAEPMEKTVILQLEPTPATTEKTMVMPAMEAPAAAEKAEPMEKTVILRVDPAPATTEKTMVMPAMEAPAAVEKAEPMEKTVILRVDPAPAITEETMVMPAMAVPAAALEPEPMEATTLMAIPAEEPSAYLTRQGQSPWPPSSEPPKSSPVSTHLVSESLLSKAKELTSLNADSALAPVPPEVTAMEDDSPLAKVADIPPKRPVSAVPDRTVDTSTGMAMTPSTLLMPIQSPMDPTVPVKRPMSTPSPSAANEGLPPTLKSSQPMPRSSQPMHPRPESKPGESTAALAPASVPGYPDRKVPAPAPETKFQTKPIVSQVRPATPAPIPMAPQASLAGSASKIWIPAAIVILLLVIGGIYFAFFKSSLKPNLPLVALPGQTTEPGLPVPADMQGTLAQAKAGDSKAMHMLGVSFYYGLNVPQNKAEGLRWMRKSAEAGNEKAKSDLRQMESRR